MRHVPQRRLVTFRLAPAGDPPERHVPVERPPHAPPDVPRAAQLPRRRLLVGTRLHLADHRRHPVGERAAQSRLIAVRSRVEAAAQLRHLPQEEGAASSAAERYGAAPCTKLGGAAPPARRGRRMPTACRHRPSPRPTTSKARTTSSARRGRRRRASSPDTFQPPPPPSPSPARAPPLPPRAAPAPRRAPRSAPAIYAELSSLASHRRVAHLAAPPVWPGPHSVVSAPRERARSSPP